MTRAECTDDGEGAGAHEWERMGGWWLTLFLLAVGVAAIAIATDGSLGVGRRATGLVLAGVLVGAYAGFGRRAVATEDSRWATAFVVCAFAAESGLLVISPAGFIVLFGLFPHCYMIYEGTKKGIAAATLLTLIAGVASYGWAGWKASALPGVLVQVLFTGGFGIVLGAWIHRIIAQSGQRASLIEQLADARADLAAAHRAAGVADERERLAAEIHDTLAQGFTSIVLLAQAAAAGADVAPSTRRQLAAIEQTARENLGEARALVGALQPPALARAALPAAVSELASRFAVESGVEVEVEVRGDPRPLPAPEEIALLRFAQEALANVRKHAQARTLTVALEYGSEVHLRFGDDGVGFDPGAPSTGFGLPGLVARLAQVGGHARVESRPGGGTVVEAVLP